MKKKLDFSGVETFSRAPEGTHIVKIASVDETTFQSGNEGFKVAFELVKGSGKGARVYENFPFQETALWKLKSLLVAIGMKADGRVTLDTNKLIGKTLELDVYHEEYEGKMRARVGELRKPELPDDDDIEDDDDLEEEDEEETPKKKPAKTAKKSSKAAKKEEPEEDDEEDEDEEEPKKPAKKSKKASKKKPEPEEDDDDDWDDDEDWDD